MQKKRLTFGVVAAQASDIEQRRIMEGIIEQAKALNIDTVVISNIYNPDKSVYTLDCRKENNIYELVKKNEKKPTYQNIIITFIFFIIRHYSSLPSSKR